MVIAFRARARRSLVPLSPPLRVLYVAAAEGVSPAWAGGLILSGWARPAGEGVWEAELPEAFRPLLGRALGVFAWLTLIPRGRIPPTALVVGSPSWPPLAARVPPRRARAWDWEALDAMPLEEALDLLRSARDDSGWHRLFWSPSRLRDGDGFADGRANRAAAIGRRWFREGPDPLVLAALRRRGKAGWEQDLALLEHFLEGEGMEDAA